MRGLTRTMLALAAVWPLAVGAQGMATGGVARVSQRAEAGTPPPADAAYRDAKRPIEERVEDLMARLTDEEKARLRHACGGMSSGLVPRIGLPEIRTLDGPNGPRTEPGRPVTYFPTAIAYAATWDEALVEEVGRALGRETRGVYKVGEVPARMLLGPGANLARSPLGARNFEYFGEDPVLSGKMAAAVCRGLQSVKVSPCMKHWVLNDQEWCRTVIDVDCPERALRELYARPFEIAAREGQCWAVMSGYNAVRGKWCSHSAEINDLLMSFGFDGAIYSDWGGWRDTVKSLNAGSTMESMSKVDAKRDAREVGQVRTGVIDAKRAEEATRRNLRNFFRMGAFDLDDPAEQADQAACERSVRSAGHRALARRVAVESAVLLKNAGGFLPRDAKTIGKVALIGPNADQYHSMVDGLPLSKRGGSGAIHTDREVTPLAAFVERLGRERVLFAPGFRFEHEGRTDAVSVPGLPAMDPVEAAKQADLVIFCGGLDHSLDREVLGWGLVLPADRPSLALKGPQAELIAKVAAVNPNVVVALTTGAPVSVEEWIDRVPALLVTWYAGGEGGLALADMVFGDAAPGGRLPYTWGKRLEDWPCHGMGESAAWPGLRVNAANQRPAKPFEAKQYYHDGIWVGYRGFDRFGRVPRWPFGFGLTYTTFAVSPAPSDPTRQTFAVSVANTGKRAGRAVVQCYVSKPMTNGNEMPEKELVAFKSVRLDPGESRILTFTLTPEAFRYWDEAAGGWALPAGDCTVRLGLSSADLPVRYAAKPPLL